MWALVVSLVAGTPFAAADGRVINDFGSNVVIPKSSKRYAVLFPMALPFLFIIHAQKSIVGYPGFGIKTIPYFSGNLILKLAPDFVKKTKDIGYPGNPNIETIVGLKPDFVISMTFAKRANEKINYFKIPVISIPGSFGSIEQLLEGVRILGIATNHTEEATKYINYYKRILGYVQRHLKNTKKPTVLFLSYQGPQANKLTSGGRFNTLVNDIIKKAGAVSVSRNVSGMLGSISIEDILRWNPDYIIIGCGGNKEDIFKNDKLRYVDALKNKRVYEVPSDGNKYSTWYAPEKSPLGLLWTAKLLHPNLFKSLNIKSAEKFYYRTFWNIPISDLKVKGDLH